MGSKRMEQMGLIEVMDQIIAQLESRLCSLEESMNHVTNRGGLSSEVSSADADRLQKEMEAIESRLSYIRAEKKEALKLLTAAEKTEERERIENIFKCAVYVGMMAGSDPMAFPAQDVEKEWSKKVPAREPTKPERGIRK